MARCFAPHRPASTNARWLPDGRRLLVAGTEPGKGLRVSLTDVSGATPRAITPEGITFEGDALALSPDARASRYDRPRAV